MQNISRRKILLGGAALASLSVPTKSYAQVFQPLLPPGGYLSAISSQWPNPSSDVPPTSRIWWTPTKYPATPCHNGSQIVMMPAPQLPLDLTTLAGNQVFNVGMIKNPATGGPMLATSPMWVSNSDPGNSAFYADPAGTWLPVNFQPLIMANGPNTYSVPAGQAIHVGTICPANPGALRIDVGVQQSSPPRRDIWNRWNRERVELLLSDPAAGLPNNEWEISSRHPQFANGNPNNYVAPLTGMPQRVEAKYQQAVASTNNTMVIIGIQYDSETYATGQLPQTYPGQTKPGAYKFRGSLGVSGRNTATSLIAEATIADLYGTHSLRALHWVESYADQYPGDRPNIDPAWAATFYGNEHSMRLSAIYDA